MLCPRDGAELIETKVKKNAGAYHCPDCSGMWVPKKTLDFRIKEDQLGFPESFPLSAICSESASYELRCPQDQTRMAESKLETADVIYFVDICPKCAGIWFDEDEYYRTLMAVAEINYMRPQEDSAEASDMSSREDPAEKPNYSGVLVVAAAFLMLLIFIRYWLDTHPVTY